MKTEETQIQKSTKARSPNYPSLSLPEAIAKAEAVYKKEHLTAADKEVIAKALGYSGINGASLTTISALKKFGLLEETDKGLKISARALNIIVETKDSPERATAIKEAALSPPLYAELRNHYNDALPSDENLRAFLLKRAFVPAAADSAIRGYRETMEFVSREVPTETVASSGGANGNVGKVASEVSKTNGTASQKSPSFEMLAPRADTEVLMYRLSRECTVRVLFDGAVTSGDVEKLIQMLQVNKDAYSAARPLDN